MIESTVANRVATIILDRPERRNALNIEVCERVRTAVIDAPGAGTRAILLTGRGTSFCSGADFDEVYTDDFRRSLYAMLRAIVQVPIPVVAAVNGPAIGAGTQLAVAADLRVASGSATFAVPTAKLGLAVDVWTIRRLSQLAGHGRAAAMLLGCEELDAATALLCGVAQRRGGLEAAHAWANELAELAPLTLAYNKQVLSSLAEPIPTEDELTAAFERCWSSNDLAEGWQARTERRRPVFRGV